MKPITVVVIFILVAAVGVGGYGTFWTQAAYYLVNLSPETEGLGAPYER